MKNTTLLYAVMCVLPLTTQLVEAGPIDTGTFYQFSFTEPGVEARGCSPADPAGDFCLASFGTPTVFLDAPEWTFSSTLPVFLTVVDAFLSGDHFEIFDFGASIGSTSLPVPGTDCGDDPGPCLAEPAMSRVVLTLAAGDHSLSIVPLWAPYKGGSGYLRIDAVPEPATWSLAAASLAALVLWRKKQ